MLRRSGHASTFKYSQTPFRSYQSLSCGLIYPSEIISSCWKLHHLQLLHLKSQVCKKKKKKNQFSKLIPTLHFKTVCVNESRGGICREGKISDLSQADTSYYQVHKIQQITKHHILLLGFAITTQKPTEICQVSCKNQSHLSTCKRWHKHLSACKRWHRQSSACKQWHRRSSTCKRWHRQTNQVVTCVTNRTSPHVEATVGCRGSGGWWMKFAWYWQASHFLAHSMESCTIVGQ